MQLLGISLQQHIQYHNTNQLWSQAIYIYSESTWDDYYTRDEQSLHSNMNNRLKKIEINSQN